MFRAIMIGFNLFLGIVGAFTLIVGGIGVSNIMNVVVEERTREIGLKMALGAKKRYVLSQFLFETLLITLDRRGRRTRPIGGDHRRLSRKLDLGRNRTSNVFL